ncbi:MAG: restriction endonuclease, partial [Bacteroidota bacterium]
LTTSEKTEHGSSKLSRYYSQMRKRLLDQITPFEQNTKNHTFRELSYDAPSVSFKGEEFAGYFNWKGEDKYFFAGVDKRLLTYQGFINYTDFDNEVEELINDNFYLLFKNGILIVEINRIEEFETIIDVARIPHYQEHVTISDIDEMNEITFQKYIKYLLDKNDFIEVRSESKINDSRFDLSAKKNGLTYLFELKLFKGKKITQPTLERLVQIQDPEQNPNLILITNGTLESSINLNIPNLVIIDRDKLKKIVSKKISFGELITNPGLGNT